jgi:phthiodiolone/phenolphthiodiolone dimycocerosates ketoreductase
MWWADRLMGWMPDGPHRLLDPFTLMAAAATATSKIQLGTAVADPVRRHPAQLAQTALSVQQLSQGRLVLGVGCGEAAGTRPYGIPYDKPVGHLEEAMAVLARLWADGEPTSYRGEFYELTDARCGLAAAVAAPPVWIAAHGPRTLRLTGHTADGWLPTAAGADTYRHMLDEVRAAEREATRPVGSVTAGAFVWVIAAESRERARELIRRPALRSLGLLLPQGALRSTPLPDGPWAGLVPTDPRTADLAHAIDADELAAVIPHGTPADIAAELRRYVAAGATHLVICDMSGLSGADNGLGLRPLPTHAAIRDALVTAP